MSKHASCWSEAEVAGHPCHLYEPPHPSKHGEVVLYLHGLQLETPVGHEPFEAQFEKYGLRVIAPVTQCSWWADRISTEFDSCLSAEAYLLEHILPLVAERWGARPPQVALLGISMGGQGALRLAYKYPDTFPVVAAIAPAIDYQIRIDEGDRLLAQMYGDTEAARQDTATLHIHPLNWPRHQWFSCDPADSRWHDSADRLQMKLAALGVPHEHDLETSAGGHSWQYFHRMAQPSIDFLAERLGQERARKK
jgi:S-formylglutathione hydrolase FrmB